MSYTVFALKWRPQNFDEIVGQEHISSTLKSAIEKNKLAHAYLLSGPRGVGKTSTARILSKALNCKEGPTANPCGICASCVEIGKGNSLDVIEIDGASNRQIDDIRTLRENVKFSPTLGKFKVYIIDEVHMLTTEAFNALLKTLEEPPPYVKFIFATTHPHKVPLTILSRCQRLDFRRIKQTEIVAQLEKIAKSEKIKVDEKVLFAIAQCSDGALRDAESILDQLSSFCGSSITLQDVVSVLGLIEQEALFEITDKIIAKDSQGVLAVFNKIIDEGKDISVFVIDLIGHFRNLMISKITKSDAKLLDLPLETCKKLFEQSQALSLEELFNFFNILANAQEMGKRLDSLQVAIEINLVKLTQNKKSVSAPHSIPERLSIGSSRSQVQANSTPVPKPAPVKERSDNQIHPATRERPVEHKDPQAKAVTITEGIVSSVTLDDVKKSWSNVFEALSKIKMSVATYFNEGNPAKLDKNILTIYFPKEYSLHKESLDKKENKDLVEKKLSEILNNPLRVNFILSQEATIVKKEDAFVKNAVETFNARVIEGFNG